MVLFCCNRGKEGDKKVVGVHSGLVFSPITAFFYRLHVFCEVHDTWIFFLNLNIDTEAMSEAIFGDGLCFSSFMLLANSLWYIIVTFTIPQFARYLFFLLIPLPFFFFLFFSSHHTNNCGIHSMKKSISGLPYQISIKLCLGPGIIPIHCY